MVTLNIGDHVGPFLLVEKLGEGGFAEVWKAERSDDADHFEALKVPTDAEYAKQLRTEDRIRTGLDHPNIVRLLGEDLEADPPYLRMEYVAGESLETRLQREGALPPREALDIAEQVALALAYAHGRNVVHADVKPSNVLVDAEGVVKLTDFGLGQVPRDAARSVLKSAAHLSDARSRSIVGTFDYMAPEQRAGDPIDARADLYALGRMLYRMLTGSLPTGLRLPSEAKPGLPEALDGLVARLLEAKESRTASAAAFISELGAARSAAARPIAVRPRVTPELKSAAIAVIATIVFFGVIGAFFAEGGGARPVGIVVLGMIALIAFLLIRVSASSRGRNRGSR